MRILFWLLIAVNLIGIFVGMSFYYPQLAFSNPVFWIFIPDCPLYVFLFIICYIGLIRNEFFRFIVAVGLIKYGIWSLFVLMFYANHFLTGLFGWFLVIVHIGMSIQFVFFAKSINKKFLLIAVGWFVFNDFMDYAIGTRPDLPLKNFDVIMVFSVLISILAPVFLYLAGNKIEKNIWIKKLKQLFEFKMSAQGSAQGGAPP